MRKRWPTCCISLPLDRNCRSANLCKRHSRPSIIAALKFPPARLRSACRVTAVFGWDNEFEAHTVDVPAFAIDQYKVTNRQYLEFIAAGGYETRAFWGDGET